MSDKIGVKDYAVKIEFTAGALLCGAYKKRIVEGELGNIFENSGHKRIWRGSWGILDGVPIFDSEKKACSLIEKVNELPYVKEATLLKN